MPEGDVAAPATTSTPSRERDPGTAKIGSLVNPSPTGAAPRQGDARVVAVAQRRVHRSARWRSTSSVWLACTRCDTVGDLPLILDTLEQDAWPNA
jgi:hypothetical protein